MVAKLECIGHDIDPSIKIIQEMEEANILGNAIKTLRESVGLTIAELAKRIWVYEWRLEKAEQGSLLLNDLVLKRIAKETGHQELYAYFLHLDALTRHGKRLKRLAVRLDASRSNLVKTQDNSHAMN